MRLIPPSFIQRILSPYRTTCSNKGLPWGFFILGIVTLSLFSCGEKTIGYALPLWPPENTGLTPSTLVPVISKSDIQETYTLSQSTDTDKEIILSKTRVHFFSKQEAAREYMKKHEPWLEMYGIAEKDGLPVREEPDVLSRRIYRLKEGQILKILSRTGKAVEIGGLEGYWYQVYTEDGVEGFLFGSELSLFEYGEEPNLTVGDRDGEGDPFLNSLVEHTWRPASFRRMIKEGSVDLEEMTPEFGLFYTAGEKVIRIVDKGINREFSFSSVDELEPQLYAFLGSSLRIRFHSSQELTAIFTGEEGGSGKERTFTVLDEDINEVIAQERERRFRVWQEFLQKGPVFSSDAYGTITFLNNKRFTWERYYPLVPSIVPYKAKNRGSVNFSTFLSQELKDEAQGVITFYFDTEPGAYPVDFLYTFQAKGIQLVHVPEENIENNTVIKKTQYPLVIFFSSSSEQENGD